MGNRDLRWVTEDDLEQFEHLRVELPDRLEHPISKQSRRPPPPPAPEPLGQATITQNVVPTLEPPRASLLRFWPWIVGPLCALAALAYFWPKSLTQSQALPFAFPLLPTPVEWPSREGIPDEYKGKNVFLIESRMLFGSDASLFHPRSESLIAQDVVVIKPGNMSSFNAVLTKHLNRRRQLLAHGKGAKTRLVVAFFPRQPAAERTDTGTIVYCGGIKEDVPISYYYLQQRNRSDYEYRYCNDIAADFPLEDIDRFKDYKKRFMELVFEKTEDSDYDFRDLIKRLEES